MNYSEFGRRFSGYSGITHLMDDLNEGLLREDMVMLGGGNPAAIAEVNEVFQNCLSRLQASGELLQTLSNYDGPQGKTSFIDTLAGFLQQQYNWPISSKNIALTHGSQSSFFILFNFFAGASKKGQQKILIPLVPEYIGYCDVGIEEGMIVSQQAKIERLDSGYFKYRVDFDQLEVDKSTGLICVSRPTNPSGNVLTDAECSQLDQIARQNNVPLVIDSAYGTPFPNIIFNQVTPFWNDNTIVCMSLSKLGLPGARTGIVIANEDFIKEFTNMTAITSLAPGGVGPVIVDQLIKENLLIPLCNETILPFYQKRSQLAVRLLRQAIDDTRVNIHKPEGSLFLWLWFEDLPITTSALYERLKRKGLLVIPGKYFFPGQVEPGRHAESCIRMNYVQSEDELQRGINILADELKACWGEG